MSEVLRIQPPLGGERPWFTMTCGFGTDPSLCDKPATWHVWWDEEENSLSCDEHMTYANGFAYYDKHPLGEVCTVPERTVVWSWEEPPGHCMWVVSDETYAAVEAAELVAVP